MPCLPTAAVPGRPETPPGAQAHGALAAAMARPSPSGVFFALGCRSAGRVHSEVAPQMALFLRCCTWTRVQRRTHVSVCPPLELPIYLLTSNYLSSPLTYLPVLSSPFCPPVCFHPVRHPPFAEETVKNCGNSICKVTCPLTCYPPMVSSLHGVLPHGSILHGMALFAWSPSSLCG